MTSKYNAKIEIFANEKMKSIFEAPTISEFAVLVQNAVAEQINSLTDDEVQKLDETMSVSVKV